MWLSSARARCWPTGSAQARADGYSIESFAVDFDRRQATCPRASSAASGLPSPGVTAWR